MGAGPLAAEACALTVADMGHAAVVGYRDNPMAIMFDFVQPTVLFRRPGGGEATARRRWHNGEVRSCIGAAHKLMLKLTPDDPAAAFFFYGTEVADCFVGVSLGERC